MGRSNKLQDKLQSTLLNKLQNTEYVDNDVDVDDVDDEEDAGAYVWSDTAMVIPTVNCIDWSAYGLARAHFDMYAA